jgi:hypothetical protein
MSQGRLFSIEELTTSTSLQEDFPASLSQEQGCAKASPMIVTSGRKCCALLSRCSPLGLLLKTLLDSSVWHSRSVSLEWKPQPLYAHRKRTFTRRYTHNKKQCSSTVSVKTLKMQDMKFSRLLFRLAPSTLPTEETGYGLLPTVTQFDATGEQLKGKEWNGQTKHAMKIGGALSLLPTPVTGTQNSGRGRMGGLDGGSHARKKLRELGLIPTPLAEGLDAGKHNGRADTLHSTIKMLPTPCQPGSGGRNGKKKMKAPLSSLPVLMATPSAADSTGTHGGCQGRSLRTDIHDLEQKLLPTPWASAARCPSQAETDAGNPKRRLETEIALIPTPMGSERESSPKKFKRGNNNLAQEIALIPTPTVNGNNNRKGLSQKSGNGLATEVKQLLPTPTVQDSENRGAPSQEGRNSPPLNCLIGPSNGLTLQPAFVEWMMGFPDGWTDLER